MMPETTTNKPRPTLDQRRAAHAWEAVEDLPRLGDKGAEEFAREAKKLPMRIMASGLGAALAFILAKAKEKKKSLTKLHDDLTRWVVGQRLSASAKHPTSLMESVIQGDVEFLRRATDESLAYLQWLNRFVEARGLGEKDAD